MVTVGRSQINSQNAAAIFGQLGRRNSRRMPVIRFTARRYRQLNKFGIENFAGIFIVDILLLFE